MLFENLCDYLKQVDLSSWSAMGQALDKLKQNSKKDWSFKTSSFSLFKKNLSQGIAFITFDNGIDGVSIEISKYAKAFEAMIGKDNLVPEIHLIAGKFYKEADGVMLPRWRRFLLKGAYGFDHWDGYQEAYFRRLTKDSAKYNLLADKIKTQTIDLSINLGQYIDQNNIQLLVPVNACSNPGNIPLAFAIVLVSELMQIPVLNSCHDFYWESGDSEPKARPQLRDHFFTNCDIKEFFSIIEKLYPWQSEAWFNATINQVQTDTLIDKFSHNPQLLGEAPTAIDVTRFCPLEIKEIEDVRDKLALILSNGKRPLKSKRAKDFLHTDLTWVVKQTPVLLGLKSGIENNYKTNNILLIQPTRILKRKRILKNIELIEKLLKHPNFVNHFECNPLLKLTLQITGPATAAHYEYAQQIVSIYLAMIYRLPKFLQERVFLAFSFGIETHRRFSELNLEKLGINQIIAAGDLVVLPSEQEGRGLPIIESSACATPIITNRYHPEVVFSKVIGEHLDESLKLNVFEFPKNEYTPELLDSITKAIFKAKSQQLKAIHNRQVVKNRYSCEALTSNFEQFLKTLWIGPT
ncbi:MAG: hypothetical protein ISR65_15070 [Bacteriovoracaceae bacterium]|nr:hypothetical protein [Bacteriovoracaceae bacterium]